MEVDTTTLQNIGKWLLGGIGVLSMGIAKILFKRADNVDRRLSSLEQSSFVHAEAMRRIDLNIAAMREDMHQLTSAMMAYVHNGKG